MPATFYLGLLLLFFFGLHAYDKQKRGLLPEVLWACNINNFILSIGLLCELRWLIAIGFLFQLGVGLPAYVLELIAKREAYERSIFMHVAPVLFGHIFFSVEGLPQNAALVTFLVMVVGLLTLSFYATRPELNVNVVHKPWEFCPHFQSRMGLYRVINASLCLLFLLAAELTYSRLL